MIHWNSHGSASAIVSASATHAANKRTRLIAAACRSAVGLIGGARSRDALAHAEGARVLGAARRHQHAEGGAFAQRRLGGDLAAVRLDEPLADGEAEAGAARALLQGAELHELGEELGQLLL